MGSPVIGGPTGPQLGGSLTDVVSTMQGSVRNLSSINQTLLKLLPRITGSFTFSAATTTIVTQPAVAANSLVFAMPTNATAALIVRTNGLFVSTLTPGASFTLSTQAGSATSGGTFQYIVINPS